MPAPPLASASRDAAHSHEVPVMDSLQHGYREVADRNDGPSATTNLVDARRAAPAAFDSDFPARKRVVAGLQHWVPVMLHTGSRRPAGRGLPSWDGHSIDGDFPAQGYTGAGSRGTLCN